MNARKYIFMLSLFSAFIFSYTAAQAGNNESYRCYKNCSIPERAKGKMQLFILAGQSNMSGRGKLRHLPDRLKSNPRVFMFGNDYIWKPAYEPHDDATNQVDKISKDKNAGVSIAMSFAETLLKKYPDMYVGLIPCSKGGTVIKQWQKNLSTNALYGSCIARIKEAQQQGKIAALLFAQGASDARDPGKVRRPVASYNNWGKLFTEFVSDFRHDIGMPNLPVIYAQIGRQKSPDLFINWQTIQQQQASINIPFTKMVTTKDLKLKDYVHYNTNSYIKLGQRFANAYISQQENER